MKLCPFIVDIKREDFFNRRERQWNNNYLFLRQLPKQVSERKKIEMRRFLNEFQPSYLCSALIRY